MIQTLKLKDVFQVKKKCLQRALILFKTLKHNIIVHHFYWRHTSLFEFNFINIMIDKNRWYLEESFLFDDDISTFSIQTRNIIQPNQWPLNFNSFWRFIFRLWVRGRVSWCRKIPVTVDTQPSDICRFKIVSKWWITRCHFIFDDGYRSIEVRRKEMREGGRVIFQFISSFWDKTFE